MRTLSGNKRRPDETGNLKIYRRSATSSNKENSRNQDENNNQSTPTNPTQVNYYLYIKRFHYIKILLILFHIAVKRYQLFGKFEIKSKLCRQPSLFIIR